MEKLIRLRIAIGGFLLVTSLILSGIVFLGLFGVVDVDAFSDRITLSLLTAILLAIGVSNFVVGIILLKR